MSLFRKPSSSERRDISSLPWNYGGDAPGPEGSMDSHLSLVPVFAATRLIADSVSTLPLQAFRKAADGRQPVPLPTVLDDPDPKSSRIAWLERCMMSLLLRGNAYGLKSGFAEPGIPKTITWLDPDSVQLYDNRWLYQGREVPEAQMFHVPALTLPGQRLGVSPLQACRSTVTAGKSTQAFMRDWFRNKAIPGMTFQNTEQTIEQPIAQQAKERLMATLRSGEPFVTGKDWKLDVVKLPAEDAGFVASAKLNATQIASIYGIPPEMIGGESGSSLTYSTVELNQIHFLTNTLRPWLVRLETAFSTLLPRPQYVKFNADAMIRADTKTRWDVYRIAREIGAKNVDEIRVLEDQPPLPNGQGEDYTPLRTGGAAPTGVGE